MIVLFSYRLPNVECVSLHSVFMGRVFFAPPRPSPFFFVTFVIIAKLCTGRRTFVFVAIGSPLLLEDSICVCIFYFVLILDDWLSTARVMGSLDVFRHSLHIRSHKWFFYAYPL